MTTTKPLPPLVAYYGSLVETAGREDEYVAEQHVAEQIIPTLVRDIPVAGIRPGDYLGDFVVVVPVPYVLAGSAHDDEYLFEVDPYIVD